MCFLMVLSALKSNQQFERDCTFNMKSSNFWRVELPIFSFTLLILPFEHDISGFMQGGVNSFFYSTPHNIMYNYRIYSNLIYIIFRCFYKHQPKHSQIVAVNRELLLHRGFLNLGHQRGVPDTKFTKKYNLFKTHHTIF